MTAAPTSLSGSAYLRLVGLGALLGIPAALVASLFLALVHDLEHWLWDSRRRARLQPRRPGTS